MHISVLKALNLAVAASILGATGVNAQAAAFGQCGGQGWTGATTCVSGYVCTFSNTFFSQCLAGTASATSPPQGGSSSTVFQPPPSSNKFQSTTSFNTQTSKAIASASSVLDAPRTTNVLASISGQYGLPSPSQVMKNGTIDIGNIQGDILIGMKKQLELFYFFQILNVASFKQKLHTTLINSITTTLQILSTTSQPQVTLNLAFSGSGLNALGVGANSLNDPFFAAGQFADAANLGDPGTANWVTAFKGTSIHGVFLLGSDTASNIAAQVTMIDGLFGTDIQQVYTLQGNIRPPPYVGHEMFGFLDGIGQPAVAGFNINPLPGQAVVNPGIILVGEPGDTVSRPAWAKDGSFLAFRQLRQLVPEWNNWIYSAAPPIAGFTQQQSADLMAARMIGRWPSGAPVDLSPMADNPTLAADPTQNNNFDYSHVGFNINTDQSHCPFSAHIRKTRPRADFPDDINVIVRAGIPYGPEVTPAETSSGASSPNPSLERGLAFVAYQSQIAQGFRFMQQSWANVPNFPPSKSPQPGFDPVIGQYNGAGTFASGLDVNNPSAIMSLMPFVVSRGGEYFFSPSISAILNTLSV